MNVFILLLLVWRTQIGKVFFVESLESSVLSQEVILQIDHIDFFLPQMILV